MHCVHHLVCTQKYSQVFHPRVTAHKTYKGAPKNSDLLVKDSGSAQVLQPLVWRVLERWTWRILERKTHRALKCRKWRVLEPQAVQRESTASSDSSWGCADSEVWSRKSPPAQNGTTRLRQEKNKLRIIQPFEIIVVATEKFIRFFYDTTAQQVRCHATLKFGWMFTLEV